MRDELGCDDYGDTDEAQDHADGLEIVGSHDDVVHVAAEAGHSDESDVDDDEGDVATEHHEMNGTGCLAAAEQARVPGNMIHHGGRHGQAGKDGNWGHDENSRGVSDLLQSVIAIEAIRLRRQVEIGVVDESVPALYRNAR